MPGEYCERCEQYTAKIVDITDDVRRLESKIGDLQEANTKLKDRIEELESEIDNMNARIGGLT
jgi:peptidoglycan hydrolase CwlO-like protein